MHVQICFTLLFTLKPLDHAQIGGQIYACPLTLLQKCIFSIGSMITGDHAIVWKVYYGRYASMQAKQLLKDPKMHHLVPVPQTSYSSSAQCMFRRWH